LSIELGVKLNQPRTVAAIDQCKVKGRMRSCPLLVRTGGVSRCPLWSARQRMRRRNQACLPINIAASNRTLQAEGIDLHTNHCQVDQIGCGNGCGAKASLRLGNHQSFRRKARQRLANRSEAYRELVAEVLDF